MSAFEDDDLKIEDEFKDWEDENEFEEEIQCLFSSETKYSSINEFLESTTQKYGFDLVDKIKKLLEYTHDKETHCIIIINYIRRHVRLAILAGETIDQTYIDNLLKKVNKGHWLHAWDYMKPEIEDDSLLVVLPDYIFGDELNSDDDCESAQFTLMVNAEETLIDKINYDSTIYKEFIDKKKVLESLSLTNLNHTINSNNDDISDQEIKAKKDKKNDEVDEDYFESYASIYIHECMLRDQHRTCTYRDAITLNSYFMKDKVVLDIGCGTGILSMFTARAGARKVIGVDMSDIFNMAQKIITKNKLSGKIQLIRGNIETINLKKEAEGHGQVDVIVSEWMGYALLFENMLSSVICARDKYLSPGGIMMPNTATIYIEALSSNSDNDRVGWFNTCYDLDLSDLAPMLTKKAQIQDVDKKDVISDRVLLHTLNLHTITDKELDYNVSFTIEINVEDTTKLTGFVISFDTIFDNPHANSKGKWKDVTLTTAVQTELTHWKQCVLWLDIQKRATVEKGTKINGEINFTRAPGTRGYEIILTWKSKSPRGEDTDELMSQCFDL